MTPFTFSLPRVAALITNEKKVDGKLVEIAYDFGDCNSMTMLIAIREAQRRIEGPHALTITTTVIEPVVTTLGPAPIS